MGGGGTGISGYNYRAAIMAGLCNGPIAGIGSVWSNKDRTTLADLGMSIALGEIPQDLWGYLETKHPAEAVNYPGLAYVATPEIYLGRSSAELPNLSFEIYGRGMLKTILDPGGVPVWGGSSFNIQPFPGEEITDYVLLTVLGAFSGAAPVVGLLLKIEFTGPASLSASIDAGTPFSITSGEIIDISGLEIQQIELTGDGVNSITITGVSVATHLTPELALFSSSVPGKLDMDAAEVVADLLTNPIDGAGLDPALLGDLSVYSAYCRAANLLISPCLAEQRPAAEHLKDILLATNSEAVPSQGVLKIIPYGDLPLAGNGATYEPDVTPIYSLDDDHFLATGEDPVTGSRVTSADAYNHVQVEFINRAKDYNVEIVEAKDQADIESEVSGRKKGVRTKNTIQLHSICDPEVARLVAQLDLQRSLYIRNTWRFKLSWNFCLLEPMDIVAITDEALGLFNAPCRIKQIDEDEDDRLEFTVEELVIGISTAEDYPRQVAGGYIGDTMTPPGDTATPIIFEPPADLCAAPSRPEIWIAASGGAAWGGCEVWISTNGETYGSIGFLYGKSRMGVLASDLATGISPDVVNILDVDVSESKAILYPGTLSDAETLQTLCYVDGELLAYRDATLTAADRYDLGYLVRGAYGTTIGEHLTGAQFARLDKQILHYAYPAILAGQTISVKLPAFNIYGKAQQSLADAPTFTFTLGG